MNASKILTHVALCLMSTAAFAEQGLDASGQSKVDNAKAKRWSQSSGQGSAYNNPVQQNREVHFGSRRGGDCVVNVGTAKPGQKAPKEIVVTTKEVINVCK